MQGTEGVGGKGRVGGTGGYSGSGGVEGKVGGRHQEVLGLRGKMGRRQTSSERGVVARESPTVASCIWVTTVRLETARRPFCVGSVAEGAGRVPLCLVSCA